jgi:hypothetical protein
MTFLILYLSVWAWQPEVLPFQWAIQSLFSLLLIYFGYVKFVEYKKRISSPITFTEQGQWLELIAVTGLGVSNECGEEAQTSWLISHKSRITSLFLFVHVISALNPNRSKWITIYKDQVSEQNYRRLCRAVIFQQQLGH